MADKEIDKSSLSFNEGYSSAYIDKDPISSVFSSFVPRSDEYEAGKAEGERDRIRDDYQNR